MRKFFTSLVACALLVVSGGFASAQQSLSKAEQDAIKNEVLPAVFEQIKEQAGIDILGWANPQLSDASISGFPVFDSGNVLRSGGSKTITLQPDSIIVTLPSSVPQVVATLLGGGYVKVTFAGYDKKEIPVGDYMMELNLPAQIKVASPKMDLFTLNFDSKLGEGKKLPFTMKVDMTVDNPLLQGVFEDKKLDLISLVVEHKEANFNAKLSLEAGLKKLAGMLENMLKSKVDLPDAFLLAVKLTELDNFRVPCSLFAVAGGITLPLGDAVIGLNLTGGFPLNYVEVTKYEKGKADEWIKLWMEKVDTDSKNIERLDVHKYKYKDAEMKDSTYQCSTAIIATKNLVTKMPTLLSKNIAQSLVANVANQMLSTQEYPVGNLSIFHYDKEKLPEVVEPVFEADLSVAMGDNGVQYVKIKMTEYDEDGNDITYVKLSFMGEKKEMVKVDIIPDEETNPALVTAYISSNVYGVATNNEKIEAPSWTIIPAREGIRVQNIDKATYQIVSMTGATVSAGTIAGDVVIPTSSLVRGKYIFVVKANGIQQAVKFIH
mgnify:FL=1